MRYIFLLLSITIFVGCAPKESQPKSESRVEDTAEVEAVEDVVYLQEVQKDLKKIEIKEVEIHDLLNIPQDASYYAESIENNKTIYDIQKKYDKNYFSVWNIEKPQEDLKSVMWPFASFKVNKSYGENLRLLEESFFQQMIENANFKAYGTINKKALTLKHSNMRAFPTIRPLLKDPTAAGEGFPFDYLQNSSIHANEPLFISHYSKDREWAFIFTGYASGWLKSNEFVVLKDEHTDKWQKAKKVSITVEDSPIYDTKGNFLFKSKVGMVFPLISEEKDTYTILAVSSFKNSKPLFLKSKIYKDKATKDLLSLNKSSLTSIINEVSKTNYGWGGMYEQRDCSSMLRDMFTPFGIWLPRNSYQQSKIGKVISLENLSDDEKIDTIKENAIPFETLLYKRGHVVLYVGTYDDEIVVFHNTWGIKTKNDKDEGRVIIGKPIFSSLRLGQYQENYDEEAEILKNLTSMNILTR
ncbi:glycoside hydrolase [Sulfurimonas crateris]|uniref:Glycoside hydrolase n=1 Tax=Sulfurimonas crateris TaxID=2574727 RepID=A0A4U2Z9Z1_9BACT|nr:SH3 domain-containing protein [Sulfurimonas crateris]TKI69831.1 glycoside hydrolase [Sulfurimonas crateris]